MVENAIHPAVPADAVDKLPTRCRWWLRSGRLLQASTLVCLVSLLAFVDGWRYQGCMTPSVANLVTNPERFACTLVRFDEENSRDPNREIVDGVARPREVVYAERLTDWVLRLCPTASEALRLAARCQHLCRWMIPRDKYPANRPGYLQWRADLKKFHAERVGVILRELGYPEQIVTRVQALNLKKDFPRDPDVRVLEDALCLVFLQYQLPELAARSEDDKMINALRKSWAKMTGTARAEALKLSFGGRERSLLEVALRA